MDFSLKHSTNEQLREKVEALGSALLGFAANVDKADNIALTFSREDLIRLGTILKLYTQRTKSHNKC